MGYIGAGISRFNTADELTVTGDATIDTTTFVVDSTNNRVGIKVSPERDLHVKGSSGDPVHFKLEGDASDYARIMFDDGTDDNIGEIRYDFGSDFMQFTANAAERMRLTSAGLLGLGTSSPADTNSFGNALDIQSATGAGLYLRESDATSNYGLVAADQAKLYLHHQGAVVARTGGANIRMTIDSSGNFMVGKTAASFDSAGFQVTQDGQGAFTRDNATVLYVNRQTSEGNTIEIRQDNDAQLIIGSKFSGRGYISTNASNTTGIRFDTNFIAPCDHAGANRDDAIDIGSSGARFKNAYIKGTVFGEAFTGESDTDTSIQMTGSNTMKFFSGSAEKARITSSTTPTILVGCTVNPSASAPGSMVTTTDAGSFQSFAGAATTSTHAVFGNTNGAVGTIQTTNSTTAYNTSSDRRLKSNIEDAASASDKIDAIQVRQFDWNADDIHQDYGLIAQELQPIEPMAVSGSADSDEMMAVDYSKLVPILIKEIQELRGRVATLEAS